MKWIARFFVFLTALIFGAYLAPTYTTSIGIDFRSAPFYHPHALDPEVTISAESLLGTWKGSWGHDDGYCTIFINEVDGNAFSGTLTKSGSSVHLQGTFDPKTRKFTFEETSVIRLGADTTEWSLGKNSGIMSQDGRIMVGDGQDKWGQYGWAVSNY